MGRAPAVPRHELIFVLLGFRVEGSGFGVSGDNGAFRFQGSTRSRVPRFPRFLRGWVGFGIAVFSISGLINESVPSVLPASPPPFHFSPDALKLNSSEQPVTETCRSPKQLWRKIVHDTSDKRNLSM